MTERGSRLPDPANPKERPDRHADREVQAPVDRGEDAGEHHADHVPHDEGDLVDTQRKAALAGRKGVSEKRERIYTLSFSPPARGATASIASAAAHPAAVWQQLITVVASLLLPIGMIGLTRLALPGSPKLALIGGALALMGFVTYPAWIAQDTLTNLMGQAGGGPRLVELWDQLNTSAVLDVYLVVFIVGHFFGPEKPPED